MFLGLGPSHLLKQNLWACLDFPVYFTSSCMSLSNLVVGASLLLWLLEGVWSSSLLCCEGSLQRGSFHVGPELSNGPHPWESHRHAFHSALQPSEPWFLMHCGWREGQEQQVRCLRAEAPWQKGTHFFLPCLILLNRYQSSTSPST